MRKVGINENLRPKTVDKPKIKEGVSFGSPQDVSIRSQKPEIRASTSPYKWRTSDAHRDRGEPRVGFNNEPSSDKPDVHVQSLIRDVEQFLGERRKQISDYTEFTEQVVERLKSLKPIQAPTEFWHSLVAIENYETNRLAETSLANARNLIEEHEERHRKINKELSYSEYLPDPEILELMSPVEKARFEAKRRFAQNPDAPASELLSADEDLVETNKRRISQLLERQNKSEELTAKALGALLRWFNMYDPKSMDYTYFKEEVDAIAESYEGDALDPRWLDQEVVAVDRKLAKMKHEQRQRIDELIDVHRMTFDEIDKYHPDRFRELQEIVKMLQKELKQQKETALELTDAVKMMEKNELLHTKVMEKRNDQIKLMIFKVNRERRKFLEYLKQHDLNPNSHELRFLTENFDDLDSVQYKMSADEKEVNQILELESELREIKSKYASLDTRNSAVTRHLIQAESHIAALEQREKEMLQEFENLENENQELSNLVEKSKNDVELAKEESRQHMSRSLKYKIEADVAKAEVQSILAATAKTAKLISNSGISVSSPKQSKMGAASKLQTKQGKTSPAVAVQTSAPKSAMVAGKESEQSLPPATPTTKTAPPNLIAVDSIIPPPPAVETQPTKPETQLQSQPPTDVVEIPPKIENENENESVERKVELENCQQSEQPSEKISEEENLSPEIVDSDSIGEPMSIRTPENLENEIENENQEILEPNSNQNGEEIEPESEDDNNSVHEKQEIQSLPHEEIKTQIREIQTFSSPRSEASSSTPKMGERTRSQRFKHNLSSLTYTPVSEHELNGTQPNENSQPNLEDFDADFKDRKVVKRYQEKLTKTVSFRGTPKEKIAKFMENLYKRSFLLRKSLNLAVANEMQMHDTMLSLRHQLDNTQVELQDLKEKSQAAVEALRTDFYDVLLTQIVQRLSRLFLSNLKGTDQWDEQSLNQIEREQLELDRKFFTQKISEILEEHSRGLASRHSERIQLDGTSSVERAAELAREVKDKEVQLKRLRVENNNLRESLAQVQKMVVSDAQDTILSQLNQKVLSLEEDLKKSRNQVTANSSLAENHKKILEEEILKKLELERQIDALRLKVEDSNQEVAFLEKELNDAHMRFSNAELEKSALYTKLKDAELMANKMSSLQVKQQSALDAAQAQLNVALKSSGTLPAGFTGVSTVELRNNHIHVLDCIDLMNESLQIQSDTRKERLCEEPFEIMKIDAKYLKDIKQCLKEYKLVDLPKQRADKETKEEKQQPPLPPPTPPKPTSPTKKQQQHSSPQNALLKTVQTAPALFSLIEDHNQNERKFRPITPPPPLQVESSRESTARSLGPDFNSVGFDALKTENENLEKEKQKLKQENEELSDQVRRLVLILESKDSEFRQQAMELLEKDRDLQQERVSANFITLATGLKLKKVKEKIVRAVEKNKPAAEIIALERMRQKQEKTISKWEKRKEELLQQRARIYESMCHLVSNYVTETQTIHLFNFGVLGPSRSPTLSHPPGGNLRHPTGAGGNTLPSDFSFGISGISPKKFRRRNSSPPPVHASILAPLLSKERKAVNNVQDDLAIYARNPRSLSPPLATTTTTTAPTASKREHKRPVTSLDVYPTKEFGGQFLPPPTSPSRGINPAARSPVPLSPSQPPTRWSSTKPSIRKQNQPKLSKITPDLQIQPDSLPLQDFIKACGVSVSQGGGGGGIGEEEEIHVVSEAQDNQISSRSESPIRKQTAPVATGSQKRTLSSDESSAGTLSLVNVGNWSQLTSPSTSSEGHVSLPGLNSSFHSSQPSTHSVDLSTANQRLSVVDFSVGASNFPSRPAAKIPEKLVSPPLGGGPAPPREIPLVSSSPSPTPAPAPAVMNFSSLEQFLDAQSPIALAHASQSVGGGRPPLGRSVSPMLPDSSPGHKRLSSSVDGYPSLSSSYLNRAKSRYISRTNPVGKSTNSLPSPITNYGILGDPESKKSNVPSLPHLGKN